MNFVRTGLLIIALGLVAHGCSKPPAPPPVQPAPADKKGEVEDKAKTVTAPKPLERPPIPERKDN